MISPLSILQMILSLMGQKQSNWLERYYGLLRATQQMAAISTADKVWYKSLPRLFY